MKSPNCKQLKGFEKMVCRPPLVVLGLRWPPLAQPYPAWGLLPPSAPRSPGQPGEELGLVIEASRECGWLPGRVRLRDIPGVMGGLGDVTPFLASSSVSALGIEVSNEAGGIFRAIPCHLRSPADLGEPLSCARSSLAACVTAVLCLFQGSPIPSLTLSQDMARMAWTTG